MVVGKQMQFFGARANLAKCMLYAINGGRDELTGKQIGPDLGALKGEYLDFDEIERPIELAADDRPGPEAILLERQDAALRKKLIRKARDAVKDPRHFEAVMLHKGEGLPITSKDPTEPDLERHFQERPRKIKHRLAAAMKAMRKALGVKK